MRRWLVGLVAAGLCAASAWAASYSLVTSMAEFGAGNYVITGEKAVGEEHAMLNEVDAGNYIHQQTDAVTVTDGVISDPDASIVWVVEQAGDNWTIYNEVAGGYVNYPANDKNQATTVATATDNSTWTISFSDGVSSVANVGTSGRKLQYNKSSPRFACYTSVQTPLKFYKEGSGAFSVALDPFAAFEVVEGEEATVTATAKNAQGDVTYSWTVDGVPADTDGNVLALSTGELGEHVVVCVATDGGAENATAEATVSYTVVAAPQAYTVTVADGIENGSVAVWDGETELASTAEVLEGTVLKVVATPATRSYKVESVTVTGEDSGEIVLENDEFAMPAENVFVTATFVERTGDLFEKITSVGELEAGAYVITGAAADGTEYAMLNEANTSTATDHIKRKETPEDVSDGSISGPEDSIIWTLAKDDTGWTIYNAEGGYVSYVPNMGNSANLEEEPSSRSHWTIAATEEGLFAVTNVGDSTRVLRYNQSNPRFACYDKPTSGKSLAFYKRSGPGTFSLALDPADDFDVPEGTEATITATAKNAQGEVTYTWNVTQDDTPGSAEGNVWTIPADAPAGGPWTVYCSATDGTGEADASVSFSIVAAPVIYDVTIDENIENGTVTVEPASGVAGTQITVTAIPDEGFALVAISVNGTPIEGNTFDLPEGGATVSATFEVSSVKTATYTVASTSSVSTTGDVPEGSEAVYASTYNTKYQLIGGTYMTLTLTGYEGAKITGLTLSMKSNGKSGAGSLSVTSGDALLAEIANAPFSAASWNGAFSSEYVDINVPVNATIDGDVIITINASANSLYCQSFTVAYEPGSPAFGITLDPAEDFDVIQNEEASVTATAKNAAGEVTYAWTVDGGAAETDGPVLALPTGELGEHVVLCVATDTGAEGVIAEASVKYTVVEAPALHAVTVADDIENGSVSLNLDGTPIETPIDLLEGTEVTVVATPADGYELEAITVNGTAIEGTTFVLTGDAEVSATFTQVVDYATLPFLAEGTPYTGPWKNARVAGLTSDGLDNDYGDGAAKFIAAGNWLQIKFEGTPGTLTYNLKGNGTTAESAFAVQESATGGEDEEAWSTLATYTGENALPTTKSEFSHELSADSRFVRFLYVAKKGNVALYDVYISSLAFSVSVDKEDGFEVEQGTADSITAEAKNAEGDVTYVWTSETAELNGEGATLAIPGTLAAGDYSVTVTATDAADHTATAAVSFRVVEPPEKFPVIIAIGILNGTVEADVLEAAEGDTVTLSATPDPGYKLGTITVTYGEETLEFTTSPATFVMPASEVLVGASFMESHDEIYVPVESEAEFVVGGEYLIVAHKEGSFTDALKNAANGTRIGVDAVTIEADGYVKTDNADIVWKILAGEEGQFVLFNETASVYAAGPTSAGNNAQLVADGTDALAQWKLDFSALPEVKIASVSYTNRCLQRNSQPGNDYFATYTGTQTSPMLFKKASSLEFAVNVDKTGFELALGEGTTVTATARYGVGDVTYVWTSETGALNGEGPELAIPDTLVEGAYSATVTATDSSAEPQTATAEVTFTVVAPAVTYPVNVAIGIPHGSVTADRTEASPGDTVTLTAFPEDGYKLDTFLLNGEPFEGDSFVMPESEVMVSAEFAEIVKYPVTIAIGILNGSVTADKEEAEAGELVTLTADPDDGWKLDTFLVNGEEIEGNTFEMPEGEALVSAKFTETVLVTFVPVASAAEFVAGDEYLVVAHKDDGFTSALKNENSGTRIGVDEVEIAADGSIAIDNDAIVWEIRAAGEGEYVLYNASAGVYAAALSDGNTAQVLADGTDPLAQWTINLADAPAVKIASVAYPSRWLQRNSTPNNKFFAAYTGSQTTPALYKKAGFSVSFDKEDGFTVEAGTADSITATALRGTEPYSYAWTGDLEGEGAILAIPGDLAEGEYSVKVTASDSSEPPQTAEKEISFTVVPQVVRFAITVAEGIVGGEVTVDKELAEAGETVTVTATPASGYELGAITVNGVDIEGNTFTVEGDSVVSATFNEIVDYATLPFVSPDTPYSGPWYNVELPVGMTAQGLGSDYNDGAAKFKDTGAWIQVKFAGTPGKLSYSIKGNGIAATEEKTPAFAVQESVDGLTWTDVAVYSGVEELDIDKTPAEHELSEDSRFVRFFYTEKAQGNVGIYDIYIGVSGELEPVVTVTGDTTLTLDGSGTPFALELALENYAGDEYTWTNNVPFGSIEGDTFWWLPPRTGEFPVTFSAMDGERTIASATVTLTVLGVPALVFDGDDEGTVGTPVSFTVVAEYVADPAVTFMGFLDVPEGSTLTDEDVTLDFPNVTFTPDVAGDYGLAFSAGTAEGGDYVEDLWIVTVAAAPAEPEVTLVDGETTVELGDDFILEFALSNYVGDFAWTSDVGEIDSDGYFTWTPTEAGEFPVVVSAVSGEETIATATVTLTVTGEPPAPVPAVITKMEIDAEGGWITVWYTGDGVEVWGTDDLTNAASWAPLEAVFEEDPEEGKKALVEMDKHFIRLQ